LLQQANYTVQRTEQKALFHAPLRVKLPFDYEVNRAVRIRDFEHGCLRQLRGWDNMEALDETTCFVRNFPFHVEEEGLTSMFGEVGPVRKTILVREKSSKIPKGVAFVSFSLKQDALRAKETFNGFLLEGRKLHVRFSSYRDKLAYGVTNRT
jgi:hypothetical protein